MSNLPHAWTPERVDELKKLWADGLSCTQIAYRLRGGATRNSVIGKVNRLGLPPRCNRQWHQRQGRTLLSQVHVETDPTRQNRSLNRLETVVARETRKRGSSGLFERMRSEPLPPPSETDIARVSFADLEPHHCRFIPGDPKASGKLYCGCDAVPGLPYCEAHAARCFDVAKFDRQRVRPFAGMRENSHDTTRAVDKLLGDREHA